MMYLVCLTHKKRYTTLDEAPGAETHNHIDHSSMCEHHDAEIGGGEEAFPQRG
jgi:hypothetical protein